MTMLAFVHGDHSQQGAVKKTTRAVGTKKAHQAHLRALACVEDELQIIVVNAHAANGIQVIQLDLKG